MKNDELLKRTDVALGNINRLMNGITSCDIAIKTLSEQPEIVIRGKFGEVSLDDVEVGLQQKTKAYLARLISHKINAQQDTLASTLEKVLNTIEEIFPKDPEEPADYPYPPMPKAFGAVSADDVEW